MAAIRQEATRRLMWFSIVWSIGLAYGVAVLFYQIATLQSVILYRVGAGLGLAVVLWTGLRLLKPGGQHALGNS